jgi:uncharacterized protein (TIGR02996 family)
MTSDGRFTFAITFAIVKVLPLPVTPSRVWCASPRRSPSVNSPIARGWSPCGSYSLMILKSDMPEALHTVTFDARSPELEEAIRDDPERPDAWLVLADWLQSKGDPRGELIVVQHALENSLPAAQAVVLSAREGELMDSYRDYFLGPNAEFTRLDAAWERGFIRSAHVMDASSTLLAHPSARFLRELTITVHVPQLVQRYLDAMGDCRQSIRVLSLAAGLERGVDLCLIGDALPQLRELTLVASSVAVSHPPLPRIEVVDLTFDEAASDVLVGFADLGWTALRYLSLEFRRAPRDPNALARLVKKLAPPALRHFGLSRARIDVTLCEALVQAPMLETLDSLDLSWTDLRDAAADLLLENAARFARLSRLDLRGGQFSRNRRARLAQLCREVRLSTPRR